MNQVIKEIFKATEFNCLDLFSERTCTLGFHLNNRYEDFVASLSEKKVGRMTKQFPSGEQYFGEMSNGKRNGKGMIIYKNGDVYDGYWLNDVKSGYGVFNFSNGDRYVGKFANNLRNGNGLLLLDIY